MRTLSLCLFFSGVASAQLFSAGIKAGIPVTDPFADLTFPSPFTTGQTIHSYSNSKKFVAGGMVELHLPLGFSVEADGLYRPLRLIVDVTNAGLPGMGRDSVNYTSWEVPIVAKYRFVHTPLLKPYVAAGPSFRFLSTLPANFMSSRGFTLGGGVEFKVTRLRISPEVRYTRWGSDSNFNFDTKSNRNQAELLIGVTY
jgi:opacity protein-like surface antigen